MNNILKPQDIQIGGLPYNFNPEYWSNPGRVFRSREETYNRIKKLSSELDGLRKDAIIQILELFREHPSRVYEFEYEGSGWEGSTIKIYYEAAAGHCPSVTFMHNGGMCYGDISRVFVDEDGIIKIGLLRGNYGYIELGDVWDSVESVLLFILSAKDYASSSDRDLQYGGVFYRDVRK